MKSLCDILCKQKIVFAILFVFLFCAITTDASSKAGDMHQKETASAHPQSDPAPASAEQDTDDDEDSSQEVDQTRKINKIIIVGNKYVTNEAILNLIPFRTGETFDPKKTGTIIKGLYYGLNRFRNIKIYGQNLNDTLMNLIVVVEEKKLLKDVQFDGNKSVSEKDILSKIKFEEIPALDAEELKKYAQEIKKIYLEKGFHDTQVDTEMIIDGDQATALFKITENEKAIIKRILFTGNKHATAKDLRNIMFTREDWILSFMDKSGSFIPDRLEADKQVIEQYYQNSGYLTAKVVDIDVNIHPQTQNVTLTFEIQEGDEYIVSEVKAPVPEGQLLTEEMLLFQIPIRPGCPYSREAIVESIKRIENIWGNQGYIFANVEPSIQPDEDKKTVSISFYSELGNKITLNKLTIKGNKKTHDKIIRRRLLLDEGEILTQFRMDASKDRVEGLGYFDPRDGVNWKVIRSGDDQADLELILKEIKTGHFNVKFGWGGQDLNSPASGFTVGAELADTNLFGSGITVNAQTNWAKEETSFALHIAQPWLFDRPISVAADLYHKRPGYDEFRLAPPIYEKQTGGAVTAGVITSNQWWSDTQFLGSLGVEDVRYENKDATPEEIAQAAANNVSLPLKTLLDIKTLQGEQYQSILNREFVPSTFLWFASTVEQDERNHPMHTSRGHKWKIMNKFAIPGAFNTRVAFYKFDADAMWFTPLIGEFDLVFKLHGHLGVVTQLAGKLIPFGELYNIGGPASVRGYLFGQIGPKFLGDSFGAKKALFLNAELIFPITPDFNMKGVFFYDGGAGWDNPNFCNVNPAFVTDNTFTYRHSVGVGIRMLNPMPIRIDWGFKLDPRKNRLDPKKSESASEVHFGMTYDW